MAGPVVDERDQAVARTIMRWFDAIEQVADRLHNVDIGALVAPADIVSLAGAAALEDNRECPGVILDE